MDHQTLLLIIFVSALVAVNLEKAISWIGNASGAIVLILLAILLSNLNLVPYEHDLYQFFTGPVVPIAIILFVLGLRLEQINKVPIKFMLLCTAGALGTFTGGLISALFFRAELGERAWSVAAQLTASYIGGGENAVAIQKILDINREDFIAAFAVDNILTSTWLIVCMVIAPSYFPKRSEQNETRVQASFQIDESRLSVSSVLVLGVLSLAIWKFSEFLSATLIPIHPILICTLVAILIGQIKPLRTQLQGSYMIGSLLFFPFFFTIGAICDVNALFNVPLSLVAMPFVIVGVHMIFLFSAAKFLKMDRLAITVASQLLIGGPATAVALAQAKNWKEGISLGVILGVACYAIGTYMGTFIHWIGGML